jgi:hypothetical protein
MCLWSHQQIYSKSSKNIYEKYIYSDPKLALGKRGSQTRIPAAPQYSHSARVRCGFFAQGLPGNQTCNIGPYPFLMTTELQAVAGIRVRENMELEVWSNPEIFFLIRPFYILSRTA